MPESVWEWSTTASTNANADSAIGWAEGMLPGGVNNSARAMMAAIKKLIEDQGGKASTTGSSNAYVLATQADVNALADGVQVAFVANHSNTGAATLAVDGLTAKAIRKGADVALESGDIVANAHYLAQYDASANSAAGAWLLLNPAFPPEFSIDDLTEDTDPDQAADFVPTYDTSAAGNKKVLLKNVGVGKQSIWIPAGSMMPRITGGAVFNSGQTTTNDVMRHSLNFDATTQEFAQFQIAAPKGWDEGTVTFKVYWSHASTTVNFGVVWELQGFAVGDGGSLETAFGTAVEVADTGAAVDGVYVTAESAAVTLGNTPAESDLLVFQIARDPANGSDTLAADAWLLGVMLFYNTNANTDD